MQNVLSYCWLSQKRKSCFVKYVIEYNFQYYHSFIFISMTINDENQLTDSIIPISPKI